jgi:uncharacterized protein
MLPKALPSMSTTKVHRRRVAISGSHGMIGSALRSSLEPQNKVLSFVRPRSNSAASDSENIEWIPEQGLRDPTVLESVDAILHLAGRSIATSRWSQSEKQRLRDSRVLATQQLVAQICKLDNPPHTFIGASAIGIYGDAGAQPVDEGSPSGDDFLATLARDWEQACEPLRERGIRVCSARLGIVLNKNQGALAKLLPLFRCWLGGRIGDGSQVMSWIALEDCVAAIHWLLDFSAAEGPYNLVAPKAVTNKEFTAAVAEALDTPAILPVPKLALRLGLGEMADALLLSSCHAVPQRLLSSGFQFKWPEILPFLKAELR